MSRWSEQFESHPIHETIQTLQDWLDVEVDEIDSEHEDERRRFSKAIDLARTAIAGLDAELLPEKLVTNLNNQLRQPQIWNEVSNFASNQNVQHLRQANDHLTGQLPLVYQVSALAGPPDAAKTVRSIEEAYSQFCKAIEKAEQDFETRLSEGEVSLAEIQDGLSTHKNALEGLKAQSDQAFSEWQKDFGETQNSRAEEFSAAQIQRGEKFDETMREIRTKSETEATEISTKHNERLKSTFETYTQEVQERLDDMKAKHAAILEIHGLVGTDGVAGGY